MLEFCESLRIVSASKPCTPPELEIWGCFSLESLMGVICARKICFCWWTLMPFFLCSLLYVYCVGVPLVFWGLWHAQALYTHSFSMCHALEEPQALRIPYTSPNPLQPPDIHPEMCSSTSRPAGYIVLGSVSIPQYSAPCFGTTTVWKLPWASSNGDTS